MIKPDPENFVPKLDVWGDPISEERHSDLDPEQGWLPDAVELAADLGFDRDPALKPRQLNIRLDMAQYRALAAAAELYGVRPTTFARMLVNRGAQAALAAHRAEFSLDPRD